MPVRHTPLPELAALPVPELAGSVARRLAMPTALLGEVVSLHLQTLVAATEWNAPELLSEQFRWERSRLVSAGVALRDAELHEAVLGELDAHVDRVTHARLRVLYAAARQAERDAPPRPDHTPLADRAADYLAAALDGDVPRAAEVVRRALRAGAGAAEVIREVLQPAQVETGRRWELGQISVAEEHRATHVTSRCMGLFSDSAGGLVPPASGAAAPRMLAAAVGTEGHDLGLRMLGEVVGADGWEIDFLGGSVPVADLVRHTERTRPEVLALSATLAGHVSLVADVVRELRAGPAADVRVLVGGRAFSQQPDLARAVGADGFAADADSAVALCREWRPAPPAAVPEDTTALTSLAARYRIDPHHVAGALDLLAAHAGVSREELEARLGATGT